MPCHFVKLEGGGFAHVRMSKTPAKKCFVCGKPAGLLCDGPVASRRSGTCDRPLCDNCTTKTGPVQDADLCPEHAHAR